MNRVLIATAFLLFAIPAQSQHTTFDVFVTASGPHARQATDAITRQLRHIGGIKIVAREYASFAIEVGSKKVEIESESDQHPGYEWVVTFSVLDEQGGWTQLFQESLTTNGSLAEIRRSAVGIVGSFDSSVLQPVREAG